MKKILHYLSILLLLLCSSTMLGQLYPVQVIPQIIPPYSSKLVEYTDSSVNRMQLQMVTTDLTVINRPVYLKMYIEGNGIKAQSRDLIQGVQPLFINGGDILSLSGMELVPYFQLRNLDGISQNTYANTLPDGMYSICYEVYDLVTRKRLSQKSCAHMYLMLNDPPMLNLPMDKEQLVQGDFTNIVFSWTPRQINAINVSYTFEIKELRDPNLSGGFAFVNGLPVHSVSNIRSTTLLYDQLMPTLVAGKRYAWRVKATSFNGLAANSVFKNDGYSEVRSFTLTKDCGAPSGILPLPNGSNAIKLNWQGAPTHLKYHVQYRKEGVVGAEWFDRYVLNNHTIITDLEPGFTYEFRVGGTCEPEVYPAKPNYTYSEIVRYEIKQSKDKDKDFSCGLKADTQITNRDPMTNLVVNESFYAGDFTVKILGLEGTGSSVYTGVGSIYVPYLGITLAVEFKNIQINTDYQLINGVVETAYDKNWENVKNTNELNKKESLREEVEFEIKEITIDSEGNPKLVGTKGEEKILEKKKDYTIVDGAGKEWTIPSDFDGKEAITKPTGEKAETGVPQPENTKGVGKDGQVTEFSAKGVRIYFENASDAVYTFDNASGANASNKYGALYKKVKGEYLPYKAVENGKTDKVIARVKFTGEPVKLDSLSLDFKTSAGSAIAFVKNSDTEYELTVKGSFKYAEDQIMAVYKPKDEEKYVVAGAMQLIHLNAITLPLKIVPTSKSVDTKALESALIAQYRRVGVTVKADVLELYVDGQLDVSEVSKDDKKFLSSYTPSEQKFIEQYFSNHDQEAAFYLFVSDQEGGQFGRMPIQSQFGFVTDPRKGRYEDKDKKRVSKFDFISLTAAHELGHGAFELQHPFTQYNTKGGAANSIMDIPTADDFNQVDWKQMNMRKFSLKTVIQKKGDGALGGANALAPNGKKVKINATKIYYAPGLKVPVGTLPGFTTNEGVSYKWDYGTNTYIALQQDKAKTKSIDADSEFTDSDVIVLYKEIDECKVAFMYVTYSEIKGLGNILNNIGGFFDKNFDDFSKQKIKEGNIKAGISECNTDDKPEGGNATGSKDGNKHSKGNSTVYNYTTEVSQELIDTILDGLSSSNTAIRKGEAAVKRVLFISKVSDKNANDSIEAKIKEIKESKDQIVFLWIRFEDDNKTFDITTGGSTTAGIVAKNVFTEFIHKFQYELLGDYYLGSKENPFKLIFEGMAQLISEGKIAEKYYNPKYIDPITNKAGYSKIIFKYFDYIHSDKTGTNVTLLALNSFGVKAGDGITNAHLDFAYLCGLWNGVVDLAEGMAKAGVLVVDGLELIYSKESQREFNVMYDGFSASCKEKSPDSSLSGCMWDMITESVEKAHTEGNAAVRAHQYGKTTVDIISIPLAFAKAGKLGQVNRIMELLDPINQILKYSGKVIKPVLVATGKTTKIVFKVSKAFIEEGVHFTKLNKAYSTIIPIPIDLSPNLESAINKAKELLAKNKTHFEGAIELRRDSHGNPLTDSNKNLIGDIDIEGQKVEVLLSENSTVARESVENIVTRGATEVAQELKAEAQSILQRVIGKSTKFADDKKTLEALANILDPNSSFRKKFPDTWQKELDDILKFNNDLRCDNCGGIGRKYWPSMDEFLDYSHYFVATFDITDPNKGKKLYNWMRGLTDNGGNLSRTLPIMDEMNQTLRYLYNNKGIDVEQLIGFGSRIDGTTKFTDILKKGKPKFIELKSVKRGVGVDDLTDELNVLSGLNSNPLKNRTQFVDQFVNGYMKSIKSLDELKYVFDLYKLGDGGEDFIKKQFKELFEKKADDIFDAMTPELKAALEIKNRKGLTEKKIEEIINTIVKVE